MKITKEEVIKVAELARLKLTEEEINIFCTQLDNILEYFDKMKNLNTDNVSPMSHILPINNIEREDENANSDISNEALSKIAPDSDNGFVVVPKIIE